MSHLKELKLRFPTYTQQLVTQTFELVRSLTYSLSPSFLDEYLSSKKVASKPLFGEATVFHPVSSFSNQVNPWSERLSYDVAVREEERIISEGKNTEVLPSTLPPATAQPSIYTKKWLEDRLRTVLKSRTDRGDLSQQEFCNLVFESLVSGATDNEIQNNLCDIIGYDHVELINELIQNRPLIIEGILNSAKARPREIVRAPDVLQRQMQPIHGPTIVVQSEQEKRLEKLIRKQDRRQQQPRSGQSDNSGLDEFTDPELLRYERDHQRSVAAAQRHEALFGAARGNSAPRSIRYPFVFDQLQDIKQTTAYVGGQNLLLPENTERKSTSVYDLVHIPYGEQIKLATLGKNICPGLVRFEDLEPLGQILFKDSIKNLNLVQSVVYKTAAFSSENLLISAP